MPNPNPEPAPPLPRYAAVCSSPRAPNARVVDGDTGRVFAELPRADAVRYAEQLEHAARAGETLARLIDLSDEGDEDFRDLEDSLDAFDRWHGALQGRHRATDWARR